MPALASFVLVAPTVLLLLLPSYCLGSFMLVNFPEQETICMCMLGYPCAPSQLGRKCNWYLMERLTFSFRNAYGLSLLTAQMGMFFNYAFKILFIDYCFMASVRYLSYAAHLLKSGYFVLWWYWEKCWLTLNKQPSKTLFVSKWKFEHCVRIQWMWYA